MLTLFRNITEIQAAHERIAGGYFFTAETLRFFNSKIYPEIYGGRYFVTSEKEGGLVWDGQRRYTVRVADASGNINTAGEFGQYKTKRAAENAARKLAAKGGCA